jgi:hypothetical protein
MAISTPQPPSPDMIAGIVAEVIRRIRDEQPPPAAPAGRVPQTVAPTAAVTMPPSLPDRVITLATLEKLPAGTRQIALSARAVITPSAREFAADRGLMLIRSAPQAERTSSTRPFLVAVACGGDRQAAQSAAAVARAVPAAQSLPAVGLVDTLASIALQAGREAARGILLTAEPTVAVVAANRAVSLRAVTGHDTAAVQAAATAAAANLLILDPRRFSAGSLERIAVAFARQTAAVPELLRGTAAKGCSCQHHPH